MTEVIIPLDEASFRETPVVLLEAGELSVTAFRYRSGIAGLRIRNSVGHLVALPFRGQQIWDAHFHGRRLTMQTAFEDPVDTRDYLAGNGAYFIHCGGSAMGNPGPEDDHPLHGELPTAPMDRAWLTVGEAGVGLHGSLTHRVGFGPWFQAELALVVAPGSGILESRAVLTNRSAEERPLMYLAHVNFRTAVGGRVVEQLDGPAGDMTAALAEGVRVEPELVETVPVRAVGGWVRSEQHHADGGRDLVEYRPGDLTHTIRWLRRSADDEAFGFSLPASAEPGGFAAEDRKGHVRRFPPGGTLTAVIRHGALEPRTTTPHLGREP